MADAKISVTFAGPLVSFQDAGRAGHLRYGVTASGPMDRLAFDAAHAALGNTAGQTAIEISLGGLMLHCDEGAVTVAITGGDFVIEHAGNKARSWTVLTLTKGERLAIRAGTSGSWGYLAVAGTLQTRAWLGSAATHAVSGFGGGALRAGDVLTVTDAKLRDDRHGQIPKPDFISEGPIRVVSGPQDQHFQKSALERFVSDRFSVTDAYDRMGMRLSGPALDLNGALSIPSEPVVRGSVQVAGDGVPTVLLADHQTTGGYPKLATVISVDTDRIAQFRSGQSFRFSAVSGATAISEARRFSQARMRYLAQISVARGTLQQRLMRENLIHGFAEDFT